MKRSNPFRRAVALVSSCAFAMVAVIVGVVAAPTLTVSTVSAAGELAAGGEYHPLTPERIFDSRPTSSINDVSPFGPKNQGPSDPTFDLQLLGLGGVPSSPDDVLAVAVSITVVSPTSFGYLSAYPTGAAGTSSLLNFSADQTIPNLAIVRGGAAGKLTIAINGSQVGKANVLVDVLGWFSTSAYTGVPGGPADGRGARLFVINPTRIVDTRNGGAADTPLGPNSQRTVPFRGATAEIPNDSTVVGALVNLTAVVPTANTFMAVVPDEPVGQPSTSNLNISAGRVQANLVMVPVGADGAIHIYNSAGSTNFIVDVMAYLQTGAPVDTRAGRVIPLTSPYRALDTRQAAWGGVPLGPSQAEDWSFAAFAGSVNIAGTAVGNQSALLGNLTNAGVTRQFPGVSVEPGFLTVFPADAAAVPNISNLNTYESVAVPNMALIKYSTANQTVRVFNAAGYAHYILDVSAVVLAE